jgi:hypothetical protein
MLLEKQQQREHRFPRQRTDQGLKLTGADNGAAVQTDAGQSAGHAVLQRSWVDYEWLSPEQQEPAELFGCSYFWAGSTK